MPSIAGYIDYQRREYCKAINCEVQQRLDSLESGSEEYAQARETCVNGCVHTTFEFHHWLIDQGYLIVRPDEEDN